MTITSQSLVHTTRRQFENREIPHRILAMLYQQYHNIEDIDGFLRHAKILFPKLNCGIASLFLQYKLGTGEIINGKYGKHDHTFLKIDEDIIDITADQFGGPKVYIGPLIQPWTMKEDAQDSRYISTNGILTVCVHCAIR